MAECETCGEPLTAEQVRRGKRKGRKARFCGKPCQFASLKGVAPVEAIAARKENPPVKHGHNRAEQSPTYKVWHGMKQRCQNPKHINYANYGGRGIAVCEAWNDFTVFLADMGERPKGMTLDRIDCDGDYAPDNCRWATQKEQCNNWTRSNQFIVNYRGDDYSLQELADKFDIDRYTLRRRVTSARWPENMWHLSPDARLRPDHKMSREEQERKVFPRGRV